MAIHTANHVLVTTNLLITGGRFAGETASWGFRVKASTGGLTDGQTTLTTFQTADDTSSGTYVSGAYTYDFLKTWAPGQWNLSPTANVTTADLVGILEPAENFWQSLRTVIPTNVKLANFKMICPGVDGMAHTGSNVYTPQTTQSGSGSNSLCPEQSMVVSLYSALLSKSGRGRFHVGPWSTTALDTDGGWTSSVLTLVSAQAQTMLNAVRAISPSDGVSGYAPIVWSRLQKDKGAVVNRVRVGDEPDHMETRTKQRPEVYTSLNLT